MTIQEALQSINDYPIKSAVLESIALKRGLALQSDIDSDTLNSKAYKLATADVYNYLSQAPNVSQGGVSITFTESQRDAFLSIANNMYTESGQETNNVTYGYKGSNL